MLDTFLNFAVVFIWMAAIALFFIHHMEKRGLRYDLEKLPEGIKFWYSLGVYAGTVKLIRVIDLEEPVFESSVVGWVCKFPDHYTNKEMCEFLWKNIPQDIQGSHSKDLLIFREIIKKGNTYLASIFGVILVYQERRRQYDHRAAFS